MMELDSWKAELQQRLKPKRYAHSLSVAQYAAELARHWHMDEEKAYTAGLLHDMEHCRTEEELLSAALLHGLPVDAAALESPILLHGPLAAAILEEDYGCTDAELLEAIRCHTVPEAAMGDLAKLIYLADMVEPTRPQWKGQEELRELLKQDLDAAMALALERTQQYLAAQGKPPHPKTEHLRQIYAARAKQKREKDHKE